MTGNVKSQNQLALKLYRKLAMLDISIYPFLLQLKKQIEWYILMIYCILSFKKYPNIHLITKTNGYETH